MRGRGIDRLLRLCRIGQIDAADLDPLRRCRRLRCRVVDAGNAAPRENASSVTTLPSAPRAPVMTTTFPFMMVLREPKPMGAT